MNSVSSMVEQMKILLDIGDGCLHELYRTKSNLLKSKPKCLNEPELIKVRHKLEKKFPSLPDTQKLPGWERFVSESNSIVEELDDSYSALLHAAEFVLAAKDVLKDILVMIIDFKLSRNRMLLLLYFDLLVLYMRILFMVQLITDRAGIAAMHHAASAHETETADDVNKIRELLENTNDLTRHCIDFFQPAHAFIKMTLPQLRDSIEFANDVDELRKNYILNPITEGEEMGKPAMRKLSPSSSLSAYTELASLDAYIDYVVFTLLACPALLFEETYSELLRVATLNRLVVPIFRDINLNIHLEFEKISTVFPAATDTNVVVPKGFKLKNVMKTISRSSVANAGLLQRSRRSLLQAELSSLLNMIALVPGLIGPKLPMLLAAATQARDEVIAYFRHLEGVQIRKDSKAHYHGEHYAAEDICCLINELHRASTAIQQHECIIVEYYREFLVRNDLTILQPLCTECGEQVTSLKRYLDAMMDALQGLISLTPPSPGDIDTAGDEAIMLEMAGFRLNWDRAMAVASSQPMRHAMKANAEIFDPLAERMLGAYERTMYATVSSLKGIISKQLDPYLIGWFRDSLMRTFNETFKDPSLSSLNSMHLLWPLQSIQLNIHEDCHEEEQELGEKAVAVCNTMLTDCANFVLTLLKVLWDNISALELQHHPIEAAGRIERAMQTKTKAASAAVESGADAAHAAALAAARASQEALPGCESEFWARKQIEKLILIRQHITWLMTAAREKCAFIIYDTEYRIDIYFRDQILKYFNTRLHSLFVSGAGGSHERLMRFSTAVRKFVSGCRAVQFTYGFLHMDFGSYLQDLLFKECQDMVALPPPGLPLLPSGGYDTAVGGKERLIVKIGSWFATVASELARPNSGFIWVPQQKNFISASHKNRHESISPSSAIGSSIELHLHQDELHHLISIIGTQGVRVIHEYLLELVASQVTTVLKFVSSNENTIKHYEQNYCLMGTISSSAAQGMPEAMDALRTIGVSLVIREMLIEAMHASAHLRCRDIQNTLHTAMSALDSWVSSSFVTPVACLAADVGITEGRDLPLIAALQNTLGVSNNEYKEMLPLFPTAAAVLFTCERWEKTHYLAKYDAFENNEHCIQFAVAKLLSCFHAFMPSDGNTDSTGHQRIQFCSPEKVSFTSYVEKYLCVAAQLMLVLRNTEFVSSGHHAPYRAISMQLEFFARYCSSIGCRGILEKYYPNALIHSAAMDVSLGRNKQSDAIGKFSHPAVQSE